MRYAFQVLGSTELGRETWFRELGQYGLWCVTPTPPKAAGASCLTPDASRRLRGTICSFDVRLGCWDTHSNFSQMEQAPHSKQTNRESGATYGNSVPTHPPSVRVFPSDAAADAEDIPRLDLVEEGHGLARVHHEQHLAVVVVVDVDVDDDVG